MRLTITQAIEQSGISRTHFYGHYIKKGLISVTEENGKKFIDSSELVRVFPDLTGVQSPDIQIQTDVHAPGQGESEQSVQSGQHELVKSLEKQISELQSDKAFLQSQVVSLTNRLPAPAKKRQSWLSKIWYAKDE